MSKYLYGEPYDDIYQFEDYDDCAEHIADAEMGPDDDFLIMVEVMISKKSGERYCMDYKAFTDNHKCGNWCDGYEPRNGKNGICAHQTWGCIETGRKWKVFPDGSYEKISGRKK